jgi:CheY-like chemotaxis protein
MDRQRAQILCVDDEPNVLEGLSMHLRRSYELFTATSGREALETLRERPGIAVVLSDMRMPGMDGAALLAKARELAPQVVRMLLTGQTELDAAISAVNDGQIFRFLTKPCPPPRLLAAVEAAVEQHRLLGAERVLLEQTLHGSIKALTDVLALVDPVSFGRASRIKSLVGELCAALAIQQRWQIEVAAMLSQLGNMTLPAETVEKLASGEPLSANEQQMVARLPGVIEQLLGNIPRLEPVRELLALALRPPAQRGAAPDDTRDPQTRRAAAVLRSALECDALEARGLRDAALFAELRARAGAFDAPVLDALAKLRDRQPQGQTSSAVAISALRAGMVFAEDVRSRMGILLAARGFEVTQTFIERVRNLRPASLPELVYIR